MANLAQWQKINRVMPGLPFGNGSNGALTSTTVPTVTYRSCSGVADSTTLTLGSVGFANGDVILIHQTRGTGVGQWEINKIVSGGGTASVTLQVPLKYTYTDGGESAAQAVKILMYSSINIASGTWSPSDWDGDLDLGGIFPIACKGNVTLANTIELNGSNGTAAGGPDARPTTAGGGGFGGGFGQLGAVGTGAQAAEGSTGEAVVKTTNNGSGGGGGGNVASNETAGGGGGGNGAVGIIGAAGAGSTGGAAGNTSGSADLTSITFGGGGGGGASVAGGNVGSGGNGGGIIIIFGRTITITGSITSNGGNGGANISTGGAGGGGGGGGSILLIGQTITLGSNLLSAIAGSGGVTDGTGKNGGNGGVGRIAVHHSGEVTGTTSPTFTDVSDGTLVENIGGYMM